MFGIFGCLQFSFDFKLYCTMDCTDSLFVDTRQHSKNHRNNTQVCVFFCILVMHDTDVGQCYTNTTFKVEEIVHVSFHYVNVLLTITEVWLRHINENDLWNIIYVSCVWECEKNNQLPLCDKDREVSTCLQPTGLYIPLISVQPWHHWTVFSPRVNITLFKSIIWRYNKDDV